MNIQQQYTLRTCVKMIRNVPPDQRPMASLKIAKSQAHFLSVSHQKAILKKKMFSSNREQIGDSSLDLKCFPRVFIPIITTSTCVYTDAHLITNKSQTRTIQEASVFNY